MKFIIIGMGQFGRALALALSRRGYEITVIDNNEETIAQVKDYVTYSLVADASNPRTLKMLDLSGENLRVVVAIGESFERSILITAYLKKMGVKHIYARAVNAIHENLLSLLEVDGMIHAEDMAAEQLAFRFDNMSFLRHTSIDQSHAVAEIRLPEEWIGKKLIDVQLRENYKLNLLTVRRGEENTKPEKDIFALPDSPVIDFPSPEFIFEKGDLLILFGQETALASFVSHFNI